MALAFTQISYWIWGAKGHDTPNSPLTNTPDFPSVFREPDYLKFPPVNGPRIRSNSRRIKRKWQTREERKIDKEYDVVLVPSDGGGCLSGSESDDSDWSIGWLEPHAPEFQGENETENSFAVLVPCYGHGRCEMVNTTSKNPVLNSADFMDEVSDNRKYVEEWLSSL